MIVADDRDLAVAVPAEVVELRGEDGGRLDVDDVVDDRGLRHQRAGARIFRFQAEVFSEAELFSEQQ